MFLLNFKIKKFKLAFDIWKNIVIEELAENIILLMVKIIKKDRENDYFGNADDVFQTSMSFVEVNFLKKFMQLDDFKKYLG